MGKLWRHKTPGGEESVVEAGEQPQREPRSFEPVLRVLRGVLLGVVVLSPEAVAWRGLLQLAEREFGLSNGWQYLVPLLFGAAGFYVALLAQRYILTGDSATTERMLTWVYALSGAGFNWWFFESASRHPSALFFGGASLSAALLWDRTLRAWRRDQLRKVGALERPLPRFRGLRWVLAPLPTFQAFRLAVLEGATTPREALALVEAAKARDPKAQHKEAQPSPASAENVEPEVEEPITAAHEPAVSAPRDLVAAGPHDVADLAQLAELGARNKAEAVRLAWRLNGVQGLPSLGDIAPALSLLQAAGLEVSAKYVREVRLRDLRAAEATEQERPHLIVAGA